MSRIAKAAAVLAGTGAVALSGAGLAVADSGASGVAAHSPGVGSGNAVQVPVHIPVNLCGNTVTVIGLINPAFGNTCANVDGGDHHRDGGYGA
ncbi:chaplin [Streptomyces sp. NPDC058579]|uniref:chaplin n=1 Tax=Streptomyces sp. NPDC058579 TaxID=3346548 RepID=UPI00364D682E